jgi:hypothetical protein
MEEEAGRAQLDEEAAPWFEEEAAPSLSIPPPMS